MTFIDSTAYRQLIFISIRKLNYLLGFKSWSSGLWRLQIHSPWR